MGFLCIILKIDIVTALQLLIKKNYDTNLHVVLVRSIKYLLLQN